MASDKNRTDVLRDLPGERVRDVKLGASTSKHHGETQKGQSARKSNGHVNRGGSAVVLVRRSALTRGGGRGSGGRGTLRHTTRCRARVLLLSRRGRSTGWCGRGARARRGVACGTTGCLAAETATCRRRRRSGLAWISESTDTPWDGVTVSLSSVGRRIRMTVRVGDGESSSPVCGLGRRGRELVEVDGRVGNNLNLDEKM